MTKIRNYFIVLASVFAISSACALVGVQDVKAAEPAMSDLIKRIEALESTPKGGNVVAPKIRGLKMGFEIRHRFEGRQNNDGNRQNRGTDFTLQRTRIYLDADVNKNVRGFVKLQDSRTWGAEQNTVGNLARVDLLEGYAELRNLGDLNSLLTNVEVRAGRWQQWYGNHRWFGTLNWANQSRSYDGLRVRYDNKKNAWVDLWGYQIQERDTGGASGDIGNGSRISGSGGANVGGVGTSLSGDTSTTDEIFWGFYSGIKVAEGLTVEPYTAIRQIAGDRRDQGNTSGIGRNSGTKETRYHIGARIVGKNIPWLPGVDFTFEQAFQRGRTTSGSGRLGAASKSIDAYGGAYNVGYTFKNVPWTPRVGYGYVFASGDDDPNDGDNKTFSQLYPTGHATMGYIDFMAWQNIRDHQFHLTFKPTKKLLVKATWHNFSADQRTDSWYTVAGGARANSSGGGFTTSNNYGDEIDLTLKYKMFKNFGVVFGYSRFINGKYVEDYANSNKGTTTPRVAGGNNDQDSNWFYIMTTMKF